jgi:hypothetical protein
MDDTNTTLDQADEEILTYTVSDEALESAAGTDRELLTFITYGDPWCRNTYITRCC